MNAAAIAQITEKLKEELARRPPTTRAAIIGATPAAIDLVGFFVSMGIEHQLLGVYSNGGTATFDSPASAARPLERLAEDCPELVLIASDDDKEEFILAALPYLTAQTKIILGGFNHFRFRDANFERMIASSLVPSFANGYPNTLIHIYQCLCNAARQKLEGVVAEFGMFKGGTTMLLSRFIETLGQDWKVYGFDTFDGFPAPRSPLDMYDHPDCVFLDIDVVNQLFAGRNVEIIPGDVIQTVQSLRDKDVVLAFIDTDNYTSASHILDVIADQIVVGGAIIFDHFTGRERFLYTLGERIAAQRLLSDARYFNLHDSGVFFRIN
jgi:O-methyltransferase